MKNDQQRFTRLLEPEFKRANMFCRKLSGDPNRGDDLFGEALVIACKRLGSLKDENAFRPWLYRIIINRFKSETRRPWFKRMVPLSREMELSIVGENPVDVNNARRWLKRAFETLSPQSRALVSLHELEGWPIDEVARMFGRSESWVKVNLFRARKKMREILERESKEENKGKDNS